MLGWTTYLIKSVPVYRDLPVPRKVLYTKAQLETLGLDRVYLQEVMVPKWVRGEKKLPTYKIIKLKLQYLCALGGSIAKTGLTAEVIEVHSIKVS
jgi:hypothetical protein